MAPGGPLPLAPLGHPAGLPLRRCACSGQSGMRGTFRPLRRGCRPSAHGSLSLAAASGPPLLRAPPGVRRRVPLRLSGSACRAGPRPPSRAARAPRRPRCAVCCGPRRLGPARCALGSPGRPLPAAGCALALLGLPGSPGAACCGGAPSRVRAAPGCALGAPAGGPGRLPPPGSAPAPRRGGTKETAAERVPRHRWWYQVREYLFL